MNSIFPPAPVPPPLLIEEEGDRPVFLFPSPVVVFFFFSLNRACGRRAFLPLPAGLIVVGSLKRPFLSARFPPPASTRTQPPCFFFLLSSVPFLDVRVLLCPRPGLLHPLGIQVTEKDAQSQSLLGFSGRVISAETKSLSFRLLHIGSPPCCRW